MPFIRLCDSYIDHPKFTALSASAFRLWHEGMAFCRKHQTDGTVSMIALQGFRYYQPARVKELTTTLPGEGGPLWETVAGFGYKVRNYLTWNLSAEEEREKRDDAKVRSKKWRQKRFENAITNIERNASRDAYVPNKDKDLLSSSSEGVQGKPIRPDDHNPVLDRRAADFLDAFGELYTKHRHGARYLRRGNPNLEWLDARKLCEQWADDRLAKMAVIFLTTDDEWISGTDRGFKVFVAKASWCDDRLAQWEAKQRQAS